jgi:isopentenyl diphosphate isomerase/L-lactate dehydrogenase-like FMN-dependent dehydrogenase
MEPDSQQQKSGNTDMINREYFDTLLIEQRFIDSVEPKIKYHFLGEQFSTPIMSAPLGNYSAAKGGFCEYSKGIKEANAVIMVGWMSDEDFKKLVDTGVRPVRAIKPFADHEKVLRLIENSEKIGALAITIDIDHIFNQDGTYDTKGPFGVFGPQTAQDLKAYVECTKLPIILKGVHGTSDALKCVEIGAGGIYISQHLGRFVYSVPTLVSLQNIIKVVKNQLPVFIDSNILTGIDAFKALALGAQGVCVGRPLLKAFAEAGAEGVKELLETMTKELLGAMAYSGTLSLDNMDPSVIIRKDWR